MSRVLWCPDAEMYRAKGIGSVQHPRALFSAAGPDRLAAWIEAHPWARDLPAWSWDPSAELWARGLAAKSNGSVAVGDNRFSRAMSARYTDDLENPFHTITGAHAEWLAQSGRWLRATEQQARDNRWNLPHPFDACVRSAACVAQYIEGPVWEICADVSGGLLAIGAAFQHGAAVAVAPTAALVAAPFVAGNWGVAWRGWADAEAAEITRHREGLT